MFKIDGLFFDDENILGTKKDLVTYIDTNDVSEDIITDFMDAINGYEMDDLLLVSACAMGGFITIKIDSLEYIKNLINWDNEI